MSNILYILGALLILDILVVVHELGHYLMARALKIPVLEFAVGMGPLLFGFERKGIKYSFRAIPIGGYCSFIGEYDDNYEVEGALNKQPVWKRFLITVAGPVMNFILAFVLVIVMYAGVGLPDSRPLIDSVVENTPAMQAGLQSGDVITSIDDVEISYTYEGAAKLSEQIKAATENTPIHLIVDRSGEQLTLQMVPERNEEGNLAIGIWMGQERVRYDLITSIGASGQVLWNAATLMVDSLRNLIFKGEGVDDMMGPIGIVSFMTVEIRNGIDQILNLMIIISLNLGIMNLLPIPGLDGGSILLMLVELVRRKPLKPEHVGMVTAIGLVLVLGLMVVISFKDIARLVTGV